MAKLKDLKVVIGLSKKGLTKLNADLRRTKSNFRRNFGEISAMANRAAAVVATGLAAGLTAVVKSGAELQTLKVGFRSIMGSAEGAADMVSKLNEFTASTPFRLQEVATSARQLIAVGVGVDDINDRMKMLGDIAAASGNSISDIAAAFSKVQAKGKVELENLNQLAERGIPIFAELKKVTGDANMEFGAGSVSVEDYNQALENMADQGGFANDAMVNLSETVGGKFSTAMDNVTLALGEFAEKSGLLDVITNTLGDFTDQVKRMSISSDDLVKSREEVYDITVRLRDAHKGNIAALQEEASAARDTAFAINQALGTEASKAHFEGAAAMYNRVTEAMAFASTSLSTLPAAPAGFGEPTGGGGGGGGSDVDDKEKLLEVEKSRLLTMGKVQELQGTMASDIMAAAQANHVLQGSYENVGASIEATLPKTTQLSEAFELAAKSMVMSAGMIAGAMIAGTASAGDMANMVLDTLANLAIQVGELAIGTAIAIAGIKEALKSLNPYVALAAGIALVGIGSFVKSRLSKIGEDVPQMAEGGLFTGSSLAMVGEGPGTSLANPEVVAPLDKLQQMMGGGNVTVTGMIRGTDILLSNERSALDRNRVRGF